MRSLSGLLCLQVLLLAPVHADTTYPTPEITRIEAFDVAGAVAWGMRGELGDTGHYVGLGLLCKTDGSGAVEVTAYFGSFPGEHHPVQLVVRRADGTVGRFGPVVSGGPQSGFHSPRITAADEAERFVRLALAPGSLISNGWRSFWNRASEARNREVLTAFLDCAREEGR